MWVFVSMTFDLSVMTHEVLLALFDKLALDLKDQGRVWWDVWRAPGGSVPHVGWDNEFTLATDLKKKNKLFSKGPERARVKHSHLHSLNADIPPLDDLSHAELEL